MLNFHSVSFHFSALYRVIVTRLVSAAGTGYFYTIKKPRIRERMTLRKYDPVGMLSKPVVVQM